MHIINLNFDGLERKRKQVHKHLDEECKHPINVS